MRVAAGLAAVLLTVGVLLSLHRDDRFDHGEHASLFPTCVGCHVGAVSEGASLYTITMEGCAQCHDGTRLDVVEWEVPTPTADNLVFDHVKHAESVAADGAATTTCESCHSEDEAEGRMVVEHARVDACLDCHAHASEGHLASGSDCATCHVPLATATAVSSAQIADLPAPESHEAADFILAHATIADSFGDACAVCHTRDSCEVCHLNANRLPAVTRLERDDRVAALLAGVTGEWPEPASHERADWGWDHADEAESETGCANCHSRQSCEACHVPGLDAIADLPARREGGPTGVVMARTQLVGHGVGFVEQHGTAAALDTPRCAACHTERECADCHAGPAAPEFHDVNFLVRHGADAFSNDTECAACHSREGFCRECHAGIGVVAGARAAGSYHDADPSWLLSHGLPARQNLEACTVCHEQTSCLQCHSARSGLRVSPHGPDFDPERAAERSTQLCAICHLDLP